MKSLVDYLDNEFTVMERRELEAFLEAYDLFNIIEKTISRLTISSAPLTDVGVISSGLMLSIGNNVKPLDTENKKKITHLLADLIFVVFIDFLKKNEPVYDAVLSEIKRHSLITCNVMEYDFNVFKKLIDTCAVNAIQAGRHIFAETTFNPVETRKTKFTWTGKGRLEELVYQLVNRKLIKNKRSFFDLFLKESEHIVVKWDFERKGHLAHLLHELYKKDMIEIASNRGYFTHAEKHFTGFDGTLLKANSLKKLSSTINAEPHRHTQVIREVAEIIQRTAATRQ